MKSSIESLLLLLGYSEHCVIIDRLERQLSSGELSSDGERDAREILGLMRNPEFGSFQERAGHWPPMITR